jgi:hypothetical protein
MCDQRVIPQSVCAIFKMRRYRRAFVLDKPLQLRYYQLLIRTTKSRERGDRLRFGAVISVFQRKNSQLFAVLSSGATPSPEDFCGNLRLAG